MNETLLISIVFIISPYAVMTVIIWNIATLLGDNMIRMVTTLSFAFCFSAMCINSISNLCFQNHQLEINSKILYFLQLQTQINKAEVRKLNETKKYRIALNPNNDTFEAHYDQPKKNSTA